MLDGSFRLDCSRLFPRDLRYKPALVFAALILAGCGGSGTGEPSQRVFGPGFRFEAPGGWKVERNPPRVAALHDSELVQVATFRLVRPYSPTLFRRVAVELGARMKTVAQQTGGSIVGGEVVTAGGVRSHSYRVSVADHIDQYTFVLRGRHEYQLLCRRKSSHGDDVCRRLISSFVWR